MVSYCVIVQVLAGQLLKLFGIKILKEFVYLLCIVVIENLVQDLEILVSLKTNSIILMLFLLLYDSLCII